MSHWSEEPENLPASIRARLRNIAREEGETAQAVQTRWVTERLMYRLTQSSYADRFVLKGAWLFYAWDIARRPTRDIDFLGYGESSLSHIESVFRDICRVSVSPDDGLEFAPETVEVEDIQEEGDYTGIRVTLDAYLGDSRFPTQVDLGFGEALTDPPAVGDLPVLLEFPSPRIRMYSQEAVIAEKLEAMIKFGTATTRYKDFFDLYVLSQEERFSGKKIRKQIAATFQRRGTPIPDDTPKVLSHEYADEDDTQTEWEAFLNRADAEESVPNQFAEVLSTIRTFTRPPLEAAAKSSGFRQHWIPGRGWTESVGNA